MRIISSGLVVLLLPCLATGSPQVPGTPPPGVEHVPGTSPPGVEQVPGTPPPGVEQVPGTPSEQDVAGRMPGPAEALPMTAPERAHPEPGRAPAPAVQVPGYSLEADWLMIWRRFEDRHGRPDPEGGLLQSAGDPQYLEYPFDQRIGGFPLASERAWQEAARGARLYVQSITEFTLTNAVELKTAWPVGAGISVGVRYHQLEDRQTRSHLARLVVEGEELGGTPLFFEFHLFPRWEKEDADVEAVVGLRAARLGEIHLRALALDPFVNAAYGLATSRGAELQQVVHQEDAPLAFTLELASARWAGLRGELYGGMIVPHTTETTRPDDAAATSSHRRAAAVLGGLVEWARDGLAVGATVLHVDATDTWTGERAVREAERRTEGRLYVVARLPHAIDVEAYWLESTQDFVRTRADAVSLGEGRSLASLRLRWPADATVAADLGLLRAGRRPTGHPPDFVDADAAHRLVTRVAVSLPPHLAFGLGTGWDLDAGDGVYDGSGLTVILTE
ncbi:MAG: hypothetical protein R3F43_00400 [bacterium]